MYTVTKDGITFEVTRKAMKNMRMRLLPNGRVGVSVPYSVSEAQLDDFLSRGADWAKGVLKKQGMDSDNLPTPDSPLTFIYHLGKRLPVVLEKAGDNTVRIEEDRVIVRAETMPPRDSLTHAIKELQRNIFKSMLPSLTTECEKMANISANEWRIKDMRTKWGTCNMREKRIWLRLELISYPVECIKAVMIHELTHLYEKGHTKRFYELTRRFYPDIDTADKMLDKKACDW